MIGSCCKTRVRVWSSHTGADNKPIVTELKGGEAQTIRSKSFAIHLGPLLMVQAVIGEDEASLELYEMARDHALTAS